MSTGTRVWQQERGKPLFRFQTENADLHYVFSQRNDLILVGWGVNLDLWIYLGEFDSFFKAQKVIEKALDERYQVFLL
jgi:hypothetical protein